MSNITKHRWSPTRILIGIAIAVCIIWALFPFYWAVTTSLRKPNIRLRNVAAPTTPAALATRLFSVSFECLSCSMIIMTDSFLFYCMQY